MTLHTAESLADLIGGRPRTSWDRRVEYLTWELCNMTCDRDQLARQLGITEKARQAAENAVDKLLEATGGLTVEFQFQGQFTVAVLVDPVSERVFTGAACCGAQDAYNAEIGEAISLGRAMNQRAEYFASAAFAK